jgi:diaminopropionate ammonia-lyase
MTSCHRHDPDNCLPDNATTRLLADSHALAYHRTLPGYAPTPLYALPGLAERLGIGALYVKDEAPRFGLNAFKGLGASYAIAELLRVNPDLETFCTATDGNHGRAVAWAARLAGKQAVVYVPQHTQPARIAAIEGEGAQVIHLAEDYDTACRIAEQTAQENGWQLVQDVAWPGYEYVPALIMAGYLTHFGPTPNPSAPHPTPPEGGSRGGAFHTNFDTGKGEWPEVGPAVDVVFLQVGVGSWAGAGAWFYQQHYGADRPQLVAVEPVAAAGFLASLRAGERTVPDGDYQTIMAGLNCGLPSLGGWEILRHTVDAALAIEDAYAERAMRMLYRPIGDDPRIVAGESGAAGLAGLLALLEDPACAELRAVLGVGAGTRVLVFNTEGATDPEGFARIVAASG